eukprot:274217-Chlamydomonas_euryale.AAC.7
MAWTSTSMASRFTNNSTEASQNKTPFQSCISGINMLRHEVVNIQSCIAAGKLNRSVARAAG